ncbi:ATP-dependent DNA helicase PIF1 [Eumeta japonica]|uniref:ATP-dependent DNA helicase n=1 Tax=Eumeta variegata TaxID=151549 RepID=A0A4C1SU34_EUMVA|nr:ATP-dependent DNA helicase PIF1 [Eumeta japonica]
MSVVCEYCLALKFKDESKGMCCLQGKVKLEEILPPPEPLHSLLTGDHQKSKQFMRNIRRYNNAFQMTSFKSKQVVERGFMPTFKIQGQVYHLAGSLLPLRPDDHKFLQIYFIADPDIQASTRCSSVAQPIDRDLIRSLQDMLHSHNYYIQSFKTAIERIPADTPDFNVVIHANKVPVGEHRGRYNAPSTKLHRSYDSLQYPLMLCRGENGYAINISQVDPIGGTPLRKTVSCMNYYCYRIMTRRNNFNTLLRYGMLTNQYLVDQYAKIESERLAYIRNNQTKLRAENYVHLQDALQANEHVNGIGQLVILPSSFTGGPRYLHEKSQDAMTYVRNYGKPDLFITATCNPNWPEIKENINTNLSPQDRYDIVNRVFHLKVQKLLHLINKSHIFGPPRCHMYTIEWQKRGLPHVHLLVWLVNKIRPNQIDKVISAELPDKDEDPILYEIVKKNMVHGPCGTLNPNSPCMRDSKCSKKFPKSFQTQTITSDDGYPKYRRRSPEQGGKSATVRNRDIDNRWIVPYNRLLLKIFDAHINVELCNSIKSIQYVTKYINKGSDQATFSIQSPNEVEKYQSGRYICSSEAVWRILSFEVHDRAPTIVHLAVHLENGQRLCAQDDFAKTLTYDRVPSYYTWNQSSKTFQRRKQGTAVDGFPGVKKTDALGRVYTIHPNNSECFYLRMLLHIVKGPTTFARLRTVQGVVYNTYQAACKTMGLLEDDSHWENTLSEAAVCSSATSLRYLFAVIVAFCQVADSVNLWNKFQENMASDILNRRRRELNSDDIQYDQHIFDEALFELNKVLQLLSGGTGKTFLINLLLKKVRSTGKIALAVASSGIAATLLEGGRTAHSTFKLPLKIATDDNISVCSVSKQSNTGKLMRDCSLIVWDEATMSNKSSVEALDRTMRDLRNKNSPMGGCTILFSGDFRQILPVVTRGTRADEINASLKRSNLWPHVNKLELKTNMRVSSSSRENRLFPEMLLKVGNGELTQSEGRINLENLCVLIDNIKELVNKVYPDIDDISYKTISWFKERTILSPTYEQVDKVNNLIISKIDAPTKIYYSVDTVLDLEEAVHFPTEFLNSLNPSGLPPHKMVLKVGCPVILLRNLNPPKLCNGTRLLIKSLKTFIIECTILTGCGTGEDVLIPESL